MLIPLLLCSSTPAASSPSADTVYLNANVYTVDAELPTATAFAVTDGRFVTVGGTADVRPLIGKQTRVHDLAGRTVLPGLIDDHIHPDLAMESYFNVRIDAEATSFAEFKDRLARFLARHPDAPWILGSAIDYLWDDGSDIRMFGMPSHNAWLDELVPDKPVYLCEVSGHAALVNSRALEALGITRDTPDPVGGYFVRDDRGELTGVVRETAAHLFWEAFLSHELPPPRLAREQLLPVLSYLNSLGITSITDVWTRESMLLAYQSLDRQGLLPMHVSAYAADPIEWVNDWMKKAAQRVIDDPRRYESDNLDVLGVKFVLDGGAAGQTAVMTEPFEGTNFKGPWRNDPHYFLERVLAYDRQGLTVRAHAAGDGAIRWALDAFERVRREHGSRLRHGVAHTAILNPTDLDRFATLDVIAEVSPVFWYHMPAVEVIKNDIGARLEWLYPVRSLMQSGARLSVGSDWTVTSASPWPAIETLVTRRAPGVTKGPALVEEEGISVSEAVYLYTAGGAYAQHREAQTGSVTPGKLADFIVIDQNIFEIPVHQIHRTEVLTTVVRGKEVFSHASQVIDLDGVE